MCRRVSRRHKQRVGIQQRSNHIANHRQSPRTRSNDPIFFQYLCCLRERRQLDCRLRQRWGHQIKKLIPDRYSRHRFENRVITPDFQTDMHAYSFRLESRSPAGVRDVCQNGKRRPKCSVACIGVKNSSWTFFNPVLRQSKGSMIICKRTWTTTTTYSARSCLPIDCTQITAARSSRSIAIQLRLLKTWADSRESGSPVGEGVAVARVRDR